MSPYVSTSTPPVRPLITRCLALCMLGFVLLLATPAQAQVSGGLEAIIQAMSGRDPTRSAEEERRRDQRPREAAPEATADCPAVDPAATPATVRPLDACPTRRY